MRNHNPQNHRTRFKSKTLPPTVELAKKAIGVKLPVDIDAVVRAMPDMSEFVRQSIIEKLEREASLPSPFPAEVVAIVTPAAPPEPAPKKTRARKPYWLRSGCLCFSENLSPEDLQTVRDNPDSWFLVNEAKTKVTKFLEMKSDKEYKAMMRAERNK